MRLAGGPWLLETLRHRHGLERWASLTQLLVAPSP